MSWLPTATELGWNAEFYRGFIAGMNLWAFTFSIVLLITVVVLAAIRWNPAWIVLIAFSIGSVIYTSFVGLEVFGYFRYTGDWSRWPTGEELGMTGNFGNGLLLGFAIFDFLLSFSYTLMVAMVSDKKIQKGVLLPVLILWVLFDLWLIAAASGIGDAVLLPWIRYWSTR